MPVEEKSLVHAWDFSVTRSLLKFSLSKVNSEWVTKLLPSQKFVLYNKEKFGNENFMVKFSSLEDYSVDGDYHPKCLILYMSAQISLCRALAKHFSCYFMCC